VPFNNKIIATFLVFNVASCLLDWRETIMFFCRRSVTGAIGSNLQRILCIGKLAQHTAQFVHFGNARTISHIYPRRKMLGTDMHNNEAPPSICAQRFELIMQRTKSIHYF
jgi:hypothetical protein